MGAVTLFKSAVLASCISAVSFTQALPFFNKEKPKERVADLRYGVALYHHYTDDGLQALSELLVAKKRGGIQGHGENPDIMEAGFALAYGMDNYAENIFNRVLEQNRSEDVRDAAWFYLARLRYDDNNWQIADSAASRISEKPEDYIRNELVSLKHSSAIRQKRLGEAAEILATRRAEQGWYPYLQFNLASAYAREKDYDTALKYYAFFDQEVFKREEHVSLYDKAMTASGYSYLFTKQSQLAAQQFSKVRLDSPLSNRALLGYGWAKAQLEEYESALKTWAYLSTQSLVDENVQESLLAIPYAYEKLNKPSLALGHFKQSEVRFLDALVVIDNMMINLSDDTILDVLRIKRSEALDWIIYAKENQLSPEVTYLIRLFSLERFHNLVHEIRDLLAIKEGYEKWQEKIVFYRDMLVERNKDRQAQSQVFIAQTFENNIALIKSRRAVLSAEYERLKAERDYFSLAPEDDIELIERVQNVEKNIQILQQHGLESDEYAELARRYKGLLFWRASEGYNPRIWELEKNLRTVDETVSHLEKRLISVRSISASAPDIAPFDSRLQTKSEQLAVELINVQNALENKQQVLRSEIYKVLESQRFNLKQYVAQSRLSIARILDEKSKASSQQLRIDQENNSEDEQDVSDTENNPKPNLGDNLDSNLDGNLKDDQKKEVAPQTIIKSVATPADNNSQIDTPETQQVIPTETDFNPLPRDLIQDVKPESTAQGDGNNE